MEEEEEEEGEEEEGVKKTILYSLFKACFSLSRNLKLYFSIAIAYTCGNLFELCSEITNQFHHMKYQGVNCQS